jgi:hypothetical protein
VTVANLPRSTALGGVFHRPFEAYIQAAGLWQVWGMFETIPYYLAIDGELVTLDAKGEQRRYGSLLPGLARQTRAPRIDAVFERLAFSSADYPGYSDRYLAGVCRELARRPGALPVAIGFELRARQLRSLDDIRRDSQIAEPRMFTFGPAQCTP